MQPKPLRPPRSPASLPDSTLPATAWAAMPAVFVLIWSTGFIVARFAAPHAPPLAFLSTRYAATLAVLLPIIVLWRAPWPADPRTWLGTAAVGVLLQAAYLGGVWWAIAHGMPAGVAALLVGVQPLLTAALAATVGERASRLQWLGLAIGFGGLAMVLSDRLTLDGVGGAALAANLIALAGITAGTLLQKRIGGGVDLRTGSAIQFAASLLVTVPAAWWLEGAWPDWSAPDYWIALAWSVFGLSLFAISLLLLMIRRGRATQVASLMYLTPVVTSVLAWLLFDQQLGALAWAGMLVTVAGVALAVRVSARGTA